jgi:pyruvate carboxylase subunit B
MEKEPNLEILNIDTSLYKTRISLKFKNRKPYKSPDPESVFSIIPGTILDILVEPGQDVKKGDELMILEAMKMQNLLKASYDGRIKRIAVKKGDKVAKGTLLLEMEGLKVHPQK